MVYGNEPLAVEEWLKKEEEEVEEHNKLERELVSSSGFLVSAGKSFRVRSCEEVSLCKSVD